MSVILSPSSKTWGVVGRSLLPFRLEIFPSFAFIFIPDLLPTSGMFSEEQKREKRRKNEDWSPTLALTIDLVVEFV